MQQNGMQHGMQHGTSRKQPASRPARAHMAYHASTAVEELVKLGNPGGKHQRPGTGFRRPSYPAVLICKIQMSQGAVHLQRFRHLCYALRPDTVACHITSAARVNLPSLPPSSLPPNSSLITVTHTSRVKHLYPRMYTMIITSPHITTHTQLVLCFQILKTYGHTNSPFSFRPCWRCLSSLTTIDFPLVHPFSPADASSRQVVRLPGCWWDIGRECRDAGWDAGSLTT